MLKFNNNCRQNDGYYLPFLRINSFYQFFYLVNLLPIWRITTNIGVLNEKIDSAYVYVRLDNPGFSTR
jgi:hypothetical protein